MPYIDEHFLLSAHGALPSGEVWSCGLRVASTINDQQHLDSASQAAADAWKAFATSMAAAYWGLGTTLDGVTGRMITTSGVTALQSERTPGGGIYIAGKTSLLPNQCAVVATLLTGRPGRTGKGRIYIPLLGTAITATGRLNGPTAVATAVQVMIQSINTAVRGLVGNLPADGVSVFSQVGGGAKSVVTGVRVGDVVDTQRRRRDSIAEAYSSLAVA